MKLSFIANAINGKLIGDDTDVLQIRSIQTATKDDLTILLDKHYLTDAKQTKAKAIISFTADLNAKHMILVENPRKIFSKLVSLFEIKETKKGISKLSSISKDAKIGKDVFIDDFVKIGSNTVIGNNVIIYSNVSIGDNVVIGENTVIYPNVTLYDNSQVGCRSILHSGVVLGADGFGFEMNEKKEWDKVPQISKVIIGNDVEIGANSCIDRGAIQDTIIGDGTKIDNLCQIAHNCIIGKHNVFSSSTAIAGSTIIGNHNMWGGQSGATGHCTVGNGVVVMARAGVSKNTSDGEIVSGFPARKHKEEFKKQAFLNNWLKKQIRKED
ncbi:MAG: hypothetical protein A2Y40_07930 [Candidatus Margulisbacteria bacterium GWF2_35_9]|nr:MAG: hypothetical protein A2Y40_07930 [Candidatus Margulisbacteria bacterium GWF2_35_9]